MNDAWASRLMDYGIKQALAAGFQLPFEEPILSITVERKDVSGTPQLEPYVRITLDGDTDYCVGLPGILFDIDFARAIWPGYADLATHKIYDSPQPGIPTAERWKVHLQMMVVSTERLRYFAKAIGYETH